MRRTGERGGRGYMSRGSRGGLTKRPSFSSRYGRDFGMDLPRGGIRGSEFRDDRRGRGGRGMPIGQRIREPTE